MPDDSAAGSKLLLIRGRYLLAASLIILIILGLFVLNTVVYFIITHYLPSLFGYLAYLQQASRLLLALFGSFVVYRIMRSIVNLYGLHKRDIALSEILKIILRVLFYFAVISIVLSSFGISLSTALAGGAIGGIILGLAVQTLATSMLSGLLLSSSRAIVPGEILVLHSTVWGDLLCKVKKVSIVLTEVVTHDGVRVMIPNTVLLTNTATNHLENNGHYSYPFPVTIKAHIPMKNYEKKVDAGLKSRFSRLGLQKPDFYLFSKNGETNVYNVVLHFDNFDDINNLIGIVNNVFDEAYWDIRNKTKIRLSQM